MCFTTYSGKFQSQRYLYEKRITYLVKDEACGRQRDYMVSIFGRKKNTNQTDDSDKDQVRSIVTRLSERINSSKTDLAAIQPLISNKVAEKEDLLRQQAEARLKQEGIEYDIVYTVRTVNAEVDQNKKDQTLVEELGARKALLEVKCKALQTNLDEEAAYFADLQKKHEANVKELSGKLKKAEAALSDINSKETKELVDAIERRSKEVNEARDQLKLLKVLDDKSEKKEQAPLFSDSTKRKIRKSIVGVAVVAAVFGLYKLVEWGTNKKLESIRNAAREELLIENAKQRKEERRKLAEQTAKEEQEKQASLSEKERNMLKYNARMPLLIEELNKIASDKKNSRNKLAKRIIQLINETSQDEYRTLVLFIGHAERDLYKQGWNGDYNQDNSLNDLKKYILKEREVAQERAKPKKITETKEAPKQEYTDAQIQNSKEVMARLLVDVVELKGQVPVIRTADNANEVLKILTNIYQGSLQSDGVEFIPNVEVRKDENSETTNIKNYLGKRKVVRIRVVGDSKLEAQIVKR